MTVLQAPLLHSTGHSTQQTPTGYRNVDLHASLRTSQGTEPHFSTHIPGTAWGEPPSHTIPTTSLQTPFHAHPFGPSEPVLVILPRSLGELTQTHLRGAVWLESGRPPDGSECLCAVATRTLRTADFYTNKSFTWYWHEKNPAIYSKVISYLRLGPRCSSRLLIAILVFKRIS